MGRNRAGYSLVELLVVIGIVAVLLGILLAAVQRIRASAARAQCANNLRQVGLALQNYHSVHDRLPPGVSFHDGKDPYQFMSWCARLLPFLEQEPLWQETERAYAQNPRFLVNPPHVGLSTAMPVFACPADGRTLQTYQSGGFKVAFTAFLGVEGTNQFRQDGLLFLDSNTRLSDVTDGTSCTIVVGERPPSADHQLGWWYAGEGQGRDGSGDMVLGARERNIGTYGAGCSPGPFHFSTGRVDNQCDAFHFWSLHSGGANFLFADGSVHFLSYSADSILPQLATRAGGEQVVLPE